MAAFHLLKSVLKRVPGVRPVDNFLCRRYTGTDKRDPAGRGKPDSPLPNLFEVSARAKEFFSRTTDQVGGIDLRLSDQLDLLRELARFDPDFNYTDIPSPQHRSGRRRAHLPRVVSSIRRSRRPDHGRGPQRQRSASRFRRRRGHHPFLEPDKRPADGPSGRACGTNGRSPFM